MNAVPVPTYPSDWLQQVLAIKIRIRDPGIDTFPKLYRQGPNVILVARGYFTPRRYLLWLRFSSVCAYFSKLALVLAAFIWIVPEWRTGIGTELLLTCVGLAIFFLIALGTELHKPIGRLFLGKKTVIEFTSKRVRIYRHGYGTSWPATIKRHPSLDVSADITEHERGAIEQLKLRNPETGSERATMVYQNSYWIKIIHGTRVVRVAGIYDEFDTRRLVAGIKKAEEMRQLIVAGRLEKKAEKVDLPE